MSFIEKLTVDLGEKRRWKATSARYAALPEPYRTAAEGLKRYFMYIAGLGSDGSMRPYEDLVELFEQAAADGTPVRDIVGADPLEFVEAFAANYAKHDWRAKERQRLLDAIAKAEEAS